MTPDNNLLTVIAEVAKRQGTGEESGSTKNLNRAIEAARDNGVKTLEIISAIKEGELEKDANKPEDPKKIN